jgi:alkylation response protein AidB-like acyl-CoA dehydrogenase
MTVLPDEIEVAAKRLLEQVDPHAAAPEELLGARFDAELAWVHFPPGCGGRAGDDLWQEPLDEVFARAGGPDAFTRNPMAVGMVAPTIVHHGTDEQRSRYLRAMYTGEEIWCQLFSEPGAGSDLASLATRAVRESDTWVVTGQKVWTSLAQVARWGFLLARTDPDVAKHRGLTCFVVDMRAPGVEVRPLRQMTGDSEFSEVFFDGACVPDSQRIGDVGNGWTVAITTLMNERSAIGGAVAQHSSEPINRLLDAYRTYASGDPIARDRVTRLWIETELLRFTTERARLATEAGHPGPETSVAKLFGCELSQRVVDTELDLLGAVGLVHDDRGDSTPVASPHGGDPIRRFLRSRAYTIEGGTSEIMRNVLGERVLGLPAEPRGDRGRTWAETRQETS